MRSSPRLIEILERPLFGGPSVCVTVSADGPILRHADAMTQRRLEGPPP
jgi:hypothetical protein